VEFEHHAHALACLREVNNNPRYSADFATGGKQAAEMKRRRSGKKRAKPTTAATEGMDESLLDPDGKVRIPRLIVEFTVENKAKAKQQAAHKAQQQANQAKQLEEQKSDGGGRQRTATAKKAKQSRGAKQRERKRKQLEEGGDDAATTAQSPSTNNKSKQEGATSSSATMPPAEDKTERRKAKGVKPPKKRRVDKAEENFTKLMDSYKQEAVATVSSGEKAAAKKKGKRWFES